MVYIGAHKRTSLPHAAVSTAFSVVQTVPKNGGPTSVPKQMAFNARYEPLGALFSKAITAYQPKSQLFGTGDNSQSLD